MTDKWTGTAGPRQAKDLSKAVSTLLSEGRTRTERTGVIGGEEHDFTTMSMMGPVRDEVTALDEAIRVKYGYAVTRENVRDIIADYAAALPEARKSRPVEDNRRSQEEDAGLKAAQAARDAEYQAQQDVKDAILNQVMAKAPRGAKALIVAEYRQDASDIQTDYFASHTARTVAIGFRYSSREDFRALRAAAAQFPETAHMADEETLKAWQGERGRGELEHRENYSMGMGNYLSDHGWGKSGTGWIVRSCDFPCKWAGVTEDAIPAATAAATAPAGSGDGPVTVSPSSLGRAGVVEVRFADKPAPEVLAGLKAHGFRWARTNGCWYGRDTAYAEALAGAAA